MWGIVLTDAGGRVVGELTIAAPFESMRAWCRWALESHQDAAQARLVSADGMFEYVYPDGPAAA